MVLSTCDKTSDISFTEIRESFLINSSIAICFSDNLTGDITCLTTSLITCLTTCLITCLITCLTTDRQFYEYGSFNSHSYTAAEILDLGHSCIAMQKSATKVLLFWQKSKSFVILFDFLAVRVRGLGRENGGWVIGGNKEEFRSDDRCRH